MKILFTLHDVSYRGGGERVVTNLANELCKIEGFEICVMSYYKNSESVAFPLDKRVKLAYLHEFADVHENEKGLKRVLWRLTRHFIINLRFNSKFPNYDIVIESHYSMLYPRFKTRGTKYIKIMHMVIKKWKSKNNFYDKIVFLNQAELDKWKVYSDKCIKIPNFLPTMPFVDNLDSILESKVLESKATQDSKHDLKPFESLDDFRKAREILREDSIKNTESKLQNTQDSTKDSKKDTKEDSKKIKKIIALGRMEAKANHKGFPRLIDAFSKIAKNNPTWRLEIIGQDCGQKGILQEQINALNLQDSIKLHDFTSNVAATYLHAQIYAMSSHSESLPMVLLEAASFGLPLVAYDIITIRDCFADITQFNASKDSKDSKDSINANKSNGILVQDSDENAYCNALQTLMNDENLRDKMGQNGINFIKNNFSKDVIIKEWLSLFRELKH
ncbi:glycosyltransferase [Helicobacter saguini]|uniref:Glycosyltransferase n=1 Tax=Helicobacter saguini TaxID=1548018 RepID=A0A347VPQ3_9HELI|nr:glycosyltransferase [Helicobacter saguini]MWV61261.1 glycosyltransferase [Helicobacter saguini]MWV68072.1 glycosyltransferase [Helicobacter saguini]MWV70465.1 glycosyltransferase [Helicobacter saguini]MWV72366.1 glycosyltransferase [Helicobacter saguini]TLD92331.1 glycosyltransferase [Helicobacter saguini]